MNVSTNEKEVALRADKNLFSMMALKSQSRRLHMPSVLAHPVVPVTWALISTDGTLRKTNKAALGIALEKLADTVEVIRTNSTCIIDGMSIVRKTNENQRTFEILEEPNRIDDGEVGEVWYHRRCRSVFLLKKPDQSSSTLTDSPASSRLQASTLS